jgi:hypothetical protein
MPFPPRPVLVQAVRTYPNQAAEGVSRRRRNERGSGIGGAEKGAKSGVHDDFGGRMDRGLGLGSTLTLALLSAAAPPTSSSSPQTF